MARRSIPSIFFAVGTLCAFVAAPWLHAQQPSKPAGPLKITEAMFEDYEGFPQSHWQMKAGAEVVVTFRAEGFQHQPGVNESGLPQQGVKLHYEVELRDPQNKLVQPASQGEVNTELQTQDENWKPLARWSARIPATAPSGQYPILIHLYDDIGKQQTEAKLLVTVQGDAVAASGNLAVQQIEFARTDSGPWTPRRAYALQDPIYVRYKVAGFQVSPEHHVQLEQDWTVFDSSGKEILSQQDAATEASDDFYPPLFVPVNFQLELTAPKTGDYTLRVTVHDRVANQDATVEAPFSLRP